MDKEDKKYSGKEYFRFGEVLTYFFRKRDPEKKRSFSLRFMHGTNKLSIIIFIIAVLAIIFRRIFLS